MTPEEEKIVNKLFFTIALSVAIDLLFFVVVIIGAYLLLRG